MSDPAARIFYNLIGRAARYRLMNSCRAALSRRPPAVDGDGRTRDALCHIRRQVDYQGRDFFGFQQALESRGRRHDFLDNFLLGHAVKLRLSRDLLFRQRSANEARTNGDGGDVVRRAFQSCDLGQTQHSMLGRNVCSLKFRRNQSLGGTDVNDPPLPSAPACAEMRTWW